LPEVLNQVKANPSVWKSVRSYAVDVVNSEKGTGKRAALDGVTVGGKTGTAQIGALQHELEDHAWFVAFAPAEKPTIAIATIVEYGGHGGVAAAPVAKAVLEVHFRKKGMLKEPEEPSDQEGKAVEQASAGTVREGDSHA
jgi:penicillin-binding protein 2